MKRFRRLFSLVLALFMVLAVPVRALAETYDLDNGSVEITTDATDQYVKQGNGTAEKQTTDTVITQTSASTTNTIKVGATDTSNPAEFTIRGVGIGGTASGGDGPCIAVTSGSSAEITLEDSNTTNGSAHRAGVHVPDGAALTLTGESTGSLTAEGWGGGTGIGGNKGESAGTIIIEGGTVTATGGDGAADIGGGEGGMAHDGYQGGAYDGGNGGNGADVTITGGTVNAPNIGGGSGHPLGSGGGKAGSDGNPGTLTITGGTVNGVDYTPSASKANQPSFWDTILYKLRKAAEGSEFAISAGHRTSIPRAIVKLAKEKGITLIIAWNGGEDITIAPDADLDMTQWNFSFADL